MPRPQRIDYPGARHHVYNRGARSQPIFAADEDCGLLLSLLETISVRFGVRVHGYALMPNHYHLMLEVPRGNLSAAMAFLAGRYSQTLNQRYEWDGPLFKGRFLNRVVEDEAYWRHLLAYLHHNPVRAGLVPTADRADWTSHAAYAELGPCPGWLHREELLALFGSVAVYRAHLDDLRVGRAEVPAVFDEQRLWTATISAPAEPLSFDRPDLGQALEQVLAVTGVAREALMRSRRGRVGNRPRRLAAWWLWVATRAPHREVGALLAMTPPAVSKAVFDMRRAHESDAELRAWMDALMERAELVDDAIVAI